MTDHPDLTELRGSRPAGPGVSGPDCLDPTTIAALVDGTGGADTRNGALRHLAECRSCRQAVAEVSRLIADPSLTAARVPRPRRAWHVVAAAAAATVIFVAGVQLVQSPTPTHRSPITAAPAAVPIGPVGTVDSLPTFRWAAVDGADRYRLVVFDGEGSVRYEVELAGTSHLLPDSVVLSSGQQTWWRVDARLDFDRWVASPLVSFTIVMPSP